MLVIIISVLQDKSFLRYSYFGVLCVASVLYMYRAVGQCFYLVLHLIQCSYFAVLLLFLPLRKNIADTCVNINPTYIGVCSFTTVKLVKSDACVIGCLFSFPHDFFFFSSPELKAQVSFSDHLSSGGCLSVCLSVCKLFTFSSSSPEPLCQFQPNLAQSILG